MKKNQIIEVAYILFGFLLVLDISYAVTYLKDVYPVSNNTYTLGNGTYIWSNITVKDAFITRNLNLSMNTRIDGCMQYNCSQPTGCVTLGVCI